MILMLHLDNTITLIIDHPFHLLQLFLLYFYYMLFLFHNLLIMSNNLLLIDILIHHALPLTPFCLIFFYVRLLSIFYICQPTFHLLYYLIEFILLMLLFLILLLLLHLLLLIFYILIQPFNLPIFLLYRFLLI